MRSDVPSAAKQEAAYVFESARLLPGDIVLSTVPADLLSRTIRVATWSAFSHAAICSEPGLLVEARGLGVARVSVGRLAVRELSTLRVLRLRADSVQGAARIAATAADYAEATVLSRYWHWGAVTALLRHVPVESRSQFFCSHLVAEAYRAAGLELLPGCAPTKTVPGAFLESSHLADVTASVTRLEERHAFTAWEKIEDGLTPSIHESEVTVCHRIVDRMREHFATCGVTPPATFPKLVESFCDLPKEQRKAMDQAFAECLRVEGYSELVQRFSREYSASYYDRLVLFGLDTGQITALQAPALLDRWRSLLDGYRRAIEMDTLVAVASRNAYKASELQALQELSELYADVLHMRTSVAAALERSILLLERWSFPPAS